MEKTQTQLKTFAQQARRTLADQVSTRLDLVLRPDSPERRESVHAVSQLEKEMSTLGREQVIEQAAYTWFNRFCALRFMDANGYNPVRIVSPVAGDTQPEILAEAKQGQFRDETVGKEIQARVLALIDGSSPSTDPQSEAYRLLLISACNAWNDAMPFLFERIKDHTELLLPDDLLSANSVLSHTREIMTEASCEDVEVIGWLYQFYISEKKDDVFAALKEGKKITPENIPAATQLFTPHWIVRYLVENSLGRLWMLNHPDSRLAEQMDYYIKPEEPETDSLKISSPEEIKICDPACGSGHMLTYAFDLLYAIYEEQGYEATDIPRLILTNNLYGVEIDQRAGALAAFALTMKARAKYRRFLTSGKAVQPNICVLENIHFDPESLSSYVEKVWRDLFTPDLQELLYQWEEAKNFGSLIRPKVTDVSNLLESLRDYQMGADLFLTGVQQNVLKALKQADVLSPKYHVVVANPPYLGSKGMNPVLKQFANKSYADGKADVFAMFVVRSLELCVSGGFVSMITMQGWMFLSSFERLRRSVLAFDAPVTLAHLGPNAFDTISGEVVTTTAFVLGRERKRVRCKYIRLVEGQSEAQKSATLRAAAEELQESVVYALWNDHFSVIPGNAISYWVNEPVRDLFQSEHTLADFGRPRQGLASTNNDLFYRLWHEVSFARLGVSVSSKEYALNTACKWFPLNKGGSFRKWYGNIEWVINYENDGQTICDYIDNTPGARVGSNGRVINREFYFKECITYSDLTTGGFGARFSPQGFVFDTTGPSIFDERGFGTKRMLAYVNTVLFQSLLDTVCTGLHYSNGVLSGLPVHFPEKQDVVVLERVESLIHSARSDWNESELSWDFTSNILLPNGHMSLSDSFSETNGRWQELTSSAKLNEEAINQIFNKEFAIETVANPVVPKCEVTLNCNPHYRYGSGKSDSELEALLLADTMREFISYAVGCMLGRYSLDKPGLILANQGETADDYRQQIPEPTFAPDEDNAIPLLDGDWFEDDISERFKEFLKVTFGTEHYEENLTFLENSLYPDNLAGKKRKTIRDYFLKEFYKHHIKLYKKRPIYWLFSSPKGTFQVLIYMHRYQPDTVSVIREKYLLEFQARLSANVESLQDQADRAEGPKTNRTKALKEIEKLKKQLRELDDFERDVLYPLAQQKVEIDLDDGVKVNYNKFGTALKKVTGLTGKA